MKKYPNVLFFGECIVKADVQIGANTKVGEYVYIGANAKIGKNCKILYFTSICKDAVIGDNVFLGPRVTFLNDKYPPSKQSDPPIVEDDVVIGGGSILMPNVRIRKGAMIGAGTLVTKDIGRGKVYYNKRD